MSTVTLCYLTFQWQVKRTCPSKKFVEKHFSIVYHPNLHLSLPFLLTVRFHWIENVAGRSSGEPYTPQTECLKFNFLHGDSGTWLLQVNEADLL